MSQTDTPTPPPATTEANDPPEAESKSSKGKVAAVAGAAKDSRRRVLGVPIGKRGRLEETASTVVGKVGEPVKKVGSRFSRDS